MGLRILNRVFGKRDDGRERSRDRREDQFYEGPPETESTSLLVDHHFVYPAEDKYERRIGGMAYRVEITNSYDYPMGNIRLEFPKVYKLGSFREPSHRAKLLDPGEKLNVEVPFDPGYQGGSEDLEFDIVFFDFHHKVEERIRMKTEPLKIVVPKFERVSMDEDRYRILTSDLFRWTVETDVIPLPPDELYSILVNRLKKIGFDQANEIVNEKLYRGISQLAATDSKGRGWAAQIQVIGRDNESRILMYTFGERPLYAYNLAVKILLNIDRREDIMKGVL
ncbi:MAG: hypothetical protein JW939_06500 [Candidatus Thermoplasmatota archaeon]|nr:hypothetical protein [Candidatus Thermoplasmatota archaeon]